MVGRGDTADEGPSSGAPTATARPPVSRPVASASAGTVIGRYVVLETLGSGGMGTVLRAYDPKLHREVALKRLRAGSFEAEASARLVREAQALAQLSHPNVISVYDVEPTPDDVIVALELVRGATLGRWLRTPRTWREVVQVLVQAGRGLAAAHDANLIHRDFKPANVMISEQGQVKVMDFGLAKVRVTEDASESDAAREDARVHLRHPEALEAAPSITTRADVVLGTPPYMAPEQHVGTAASPSVDQYAFCVTLWSSLTGERPFHGDADMDALLRAKLEGPPPWPRSCAAPRRVVDAIRRGLAADPRARWPDMQALLEQLELALRRRRSRWRSLAGAALLGGGVFAGLRQAGEPSPCEGAREQLEGIWDEASRDRVAQGIQRAAGAELADEIWARVSGRLDDYADAWVEGHREACEATTIRAEQSAAVLDRRMACLHRARTALRVDVELLAALDEHTVLRAVELVDRLPMLDRCADVDALLAEVPLPDDPAAQAAIQSAHVRLAEAASLHRLGRYADALEAVRLVEAEAEPLGHGPLLAELAAQEGLTLEALGRYEQAQITLHRAVGQAVEQGSLGVAVGAIADWAFVLDERLSRSDEALLAAELGLRLARRVGQPSLEALALGRVASVLHTQGKWEESEAAYRETLALLEATEPVDVLRVAVVSNDLGAQLFERGQVDEALALHRRALEIREHELGSSHPYVGSSLTNLGNVHYARREHDEAQRYYERALALYARVYGPDHPLTTLTQGNYAALLMVRGELDRADPLLREVVRIKERTYGPDHPETANAYNNLARLEQERGNLDLAHEHLQRSLRSLSTSLGPDHPQLRTALQNLGSLAVELGRRDEAIGHFERALAVFPDAPPEDLADTKMALAKILWDDPSSRARARTLAEDAVLAYGQVESAHQELADAEAWLHTHPHAESK